MTEKRSARQLMGKPCQSVGQCCSYSNLEGLARREGVGFLFPAFLTSFFVALHGVKAHPGSYGGYHPGTGSTGSISYNSCI